MFIYLTRKKVAAPSGKIAGILEEEEEEEEEKEKEEEKSWG